MLLVLALILAISLLPISLVHARCVWTSHR